MPDWVDRLLGGWPFGWIYLFFVFGAAARSQSLYWLGRGAVAGVGRSRWARLVDNPRVHRATATVERWGMPVVPLSFLTVGFQSAVHVSSGLLRLHWLRYTLWSVPGWLVWALVWAGGGTAAVVLARRLAERSPWLLALAVLVLGGLVTAAVLVSRRRRAARTAVEALADQAHPSPAAD